MTFVAPEIRIVSTYHATCDGGEGALGHPRVWLKLPKTTGRVRCPYCDAELINEAHENTEDIRKFPEKALFLRD